MDRRIITFFLLFVISSGPIWPEIRGLALGAKFGADVGLTRDSRFALKAQAGGNLGLMLDFPIVTPLYAGLSFTFHRTWASSLKGGIIYRGYSGIDSRLFLILKGLINAEAGPLNLLLGGAGGASARFDKYQYTLLYFFYPGVFLEPFLELQIIPWKSSLQVSLPIDWYFRKDLVVSASAGLAVVWKLYVLRKEKG